LDLRFNPGGLVSSAVAVADLFLASGTIVRIHDATGLEQIELARKFGTIEDLALTVLINGSSASGSEIVAAALQDAGRARIAGSRSFGKGSVQTIVPLQKTEAAIKITSAMFDRPSGDNLDRYLGRRLSSDEVWGVRPAKELDVPMYAEENGRLHMQLLERQLRGRLDKELPLDPQLARVQQDLLGRQKRSPAGTSGQSPAE
jgi:carboxyl-terminal processing protease